MALLSACTPSLNWRDLALAGGARVMLPCKPERLERALPLAGRSVMASLQVCDADGSSWSAMAYELPDAAQRDEALREARRLLAANLGAPAAEELPMPRLQGLATTSEARRLRLQGQRPGGGPVQVEALFTAQDRWVFQLVVMAPAGTASPRSQAAVEEFLGSLRGSAGSPS
ncbi:MAG: hypothetical protein ABI574_05090 [Burkholderiales bacterium]